MAIRFRPGKLILFTLILLAACAAPPKPLLRPNGVAVAQDGSLYVMDRGNFRVVHLSASGRFLGAFGQLGDGPQDIYYGWNVALDQAGNVYICNRVATEDGVSTKQDSIKVFSPDGRLLREVGRQDYETTDTSTQDHRPYGLKFDRPGRLYVADFGTDTVRVFDPQGNLLATFFGDKGSQDGQFNGLNDVAIDEERGLLYVVDGNNSRIQQFDLGTTATGVPTVTHRLSWGTYGTGPGEFAYPQFVAVNRTNGQVYVADMANRRIQVFDPQGKYIASFVPNLKNWQVMGLNVGPDGAVYAADAFNNVIWVFQPDGRVRSRIEVRP